MINDSVFYVEGYDFMDEDEFYTYDDDDEEEEEEIGGSIKGWEMVRFCFWPSATQAYSDLAKLFLACLILRGVKGLRAPQSVCHCVSSIAGICMFYVYFDRQTLYILCLGMIAYICLRVSSFCSGSRRGPSMLVVLVLYLSTCELRMVEPDTWLKIRGSQMLQTMRAVSLAFDLDRKLIEEPTLIEFFGYVWCVGGCLFGPWVPYSEHRSGGSGGWGWLGSALLSTLLSLVCFGLSVCWVEWALPDTPLWNVYRDALVFRLGHYFISYVAQTSVTLSGTGNTVISRPLAVEFPHSLVSVVINWNIPMHRWLKSYVFKAARGWGGLAALMATYGVSTLLHGLDCGLAGVLLSLGLYTYAEHRLRCRLAEKLGACLGARRCPPRCPTHLHTSNNLLVNTANLLFTALALFHLAYLGILIDPSVPTPCSKAFDRWIDLGFASHWVALVTYLLSLLL